MPKPFIISAEVTADLPQEYISQHQISVLPMAYTIDGITYDGTLENSLPPSEFYSKVKQGLMPVTSQVTPVQAFEAFEHLYNEGFDILHLGFSSALSGSCNSSVVAKAQMEEKYPDCKIIVIDTLCASLGQGLLINQAVEMKANGQTIEDVAEKIENSKLHLIHYFTVDDLNHLQRGGRVSKTTAFVGTVLGIKPILHVDNDGKLIAIGKVRGRQQSLIELVNRIESKISGYDNEYFYISHGDCIEDAYIVRDEIIKRFGEKKFLINQIGCVVGTHSGQGTVALFAVGDER
jgi:DegV family protein with EDD domain